MANLKDFVPSFDEGDIKRATAKERLRTGTYLFQVTDVAQKVNEKGNMILGLKLLPLDSNGQVMRPGANLSLVGPFKTDPALLEAAGLPANAQVKGAPRTDFIIEGYGRARSNSKAPTPVQFPVIQKLANVSGKWQVVSQDGTPTGEKLETKDARDAKIADAARASRKFYQWAWSEAGEVLKGDTFYGTVSYDTTGDFDGPQVKITKTQDPTMIQDLVDTSEGIIEEV
jgi:hypothetical protein